MTKKKKILLLSDHALSTSGVGCQSRFLMNGLVETGKWTVRQFGAAIKHSDYRSVKVNDDFIIKPVDGFGDQQLIKTTLAVERPDVLILFTDPRFFIWLWEMEDEVHQICPIAYWHVWDNRPVPDFNKVLYDSTDLINCHSYDTYEYVKDLAPGRTNFVPHAVPKELFYPMDPSEIQKQKAAVLGPERSDHFTAFWVNRNAKRKRPGDLLWAWSKFVNNLEKNHGHRKATLLMHTDPGDHEGPNLYSMVEMLEIKDNVVFSVDRIEFEKMNVLHNICDFTINISYAEGFGLSTLEAMMCAKPIIAAHTGGQKRQVVDHRDGSENGFAVPIEFQSLVGSQNVPYIFEDYCSTDVIAEKIMKMYELGPTGRAALGQKAYKYAQSEFNIKDVINRWDETLTELTENWRKRYKPWSMTEI